MAGAIGSLVLSGCGGAAAGRATPTTASKSVGSTTTTTPVEGQIITAWFAAERAFQQAARTSDPNSPGLLATTVSPVLDNVRANLAHLRADGDVARGTVDFGQPRITASGSSGVEVVSCMDGRDIEVSIATGKPVPGVLGTPMKEVVSSVMKSTSTGWKLADQSVVTEAC
jgi:hypothetical protein